MDERALEYLEAESKRFRSRPTTITLMPEYGVDVPLWPREDETDSLVSQGLMAKLMAWQDVFGSQFDSRSGWRTDEVKVSWAEQARTLEAELRKEVAGRVGIEVDLWPLNPGYLHTWQLDNPPPT